MLNINYAQPGKVWKSKKENWIGSNILILGNTDSLEDYEQIDNPDTIQDKTIEEIK